MNYRTVPQIATEENLSRPTIYNWIRWGKLKSTRVGGQHRVTEEQWREFLDSCNRK